MRVLIICENTIDRSEFHWITALPGHGIDPHVVIGPDSADIPRLRDAAIEVTPIRMRSRIDRKAARALRRVLAANRADLVHCLGSHKQVANALAATRKDPTPIVAYRGTMGHLNRWDPTSWLSYLNPRLRCIVCASDAVKNSLAQLPVPEPRLRTIYKGHDPAWYQAADRDMLTELGVPDDAFVVGCAARIRALKGVPVLIEALHRMRSHDVHLLLVGENHDPHVRGMARAPELGKRIHLVGRRDDAASLMGACDVFAMCSLRREGMPRALIEAMSQGVPPVVSNVGGMPELVVDGECGRVVPVSDSTALADALWTLRSDADLRASMGRAARARIESHFSIQQTITQTVALYRDMV